MNNTEDILEAICIGLAVATFLLNTGRGLKAIDICKECFIFLSNEVHVLKKEDHIFNSVNIAIYETMFMAYYLFTDYTNTAKYGWKLLDIYRECGNTVKEVNLTLILANIYEQQSNYAEARELYKKGIHFMRETGDKNAEAYVYGKFGTMSHRLGECYKAKEYLEKALAITIETGDRAGEALNYENLGAVFQSVCEYDKAKEYLEKALIIKTEIGDRKGKASCYGNLGAVFGYLGKYNKAQEYLEKALVIRREICDRKGEATDYGNLGTVFQSLGECDKAKEYLEKALAITVETGNRAGEALNYGNLGAVFESVCEYDKAIEYFEKALAIETEIGDKNGEASCYGNLGAVFLSLGKYNKAQEYLEKALVIRREICDRKGEAADYGNLGTVFQSLGEYVKSKENLEKALAISIEIGDRAGEASCYGNIGVVLQSLSEYDKAKEYLEKAIAIRIKISDRKGEATAYANLGTVFQSLGEYGKAKEYFEKALAIRIDIGDRQGAASCYGNLGTVFEALGEYVKTKRYLEKALVIRIEIGDRAGQAADYTNLGAMFICTSEYDKAKGYLEKALALTTDIGDKKGVARCYANLGTVFQSLGEYDKAKKYLEKALAIGREIGDRKGEASCYDLLGTLLISLGEYDKTKEYIEKALAIWIEIGDRREEAVAYGSLGIVYGNVGEYDKANEHLEKALAISVEIGDRKGEAARYGNLGTMFKSLGEYERAKEYFQKALAIRIGIGDRKGEAVDYANLGTVFQTLGEYDKAEDYLKKALSIAQDIGDLGIEIQFRFSLTMVKLSQWKIQEAVQWLLLSMEKSERLRDFLRDNDEFKISFADVHDFPYRTLCFLCCIFENPNNALYVLELARARALADLMATQYSVKWQISANPETWQGFENIMRKERNCTCLYISYYVQHLFLWILKTNGVIHFRKKEAHENIDGAELLGSLDEFFANNFRSFGILPEEDCEDRSLSPIESERKSYEVESLSALRFVEDDNEESRNSESPLSLCHRILIGSVADLLKEREILIVPDRCLNRVPFAALRDKNGKYLSETFRIRIVPSLTTLKLIQDSRADYHDQTGALIVGDPDVGRVRYNGSKTNFSRLPYAGKEATMIGQLLGVQPLLGQHATKQAVLERLHSVGLVHFAAHGNAERGEIALSPVRSSNKIPKEADYLLTMSDIAQAQLRAKLVVLSCCHSARGQIRAEGVIGIARAFLGSGARSVLVALWAINDRATEQLMWHFYEHLFRGESASESLHQAMKWMRGNDFSNVCEWAPFMLIGDDVTFEFGKQE